MGTRRRGSKKVNLKKAPGRAGTKCRGKKIREQMPESQFHLAHVQGHHHSEIPLMKYRRRDAII